MLDTSNYTISNALNYQMFLGHYQEATNSQGTLGHRLCHAFLAIIELPPIVGQIAALFELAVVKILGKSKECCHKDLSENKIEAVDGKILTNDQKDPKELDQKSVPFLSRKIVIAVLALLIIVPTTCYAYSLGYFPGSQPELGDLADAASKILPGAEDFIEIVSSSLPNPGNL